ncbi:MAG: hypothetical protein WKF57_05670 [Nakamurella sp.]
MSRVILLQTSLSRDVGDDDALIATARSVTEHAAAADISIDLIAATDEPGRTAAVTGLPAIRAVAGTVRRVWDSSSTVVVLGGTLGAGRATSAVPLAELSVLGMWAQASGRRLALVGVRVEPARSRTEGSLLRRVVHGASLTVAADANSAEALTAVGVPAPVRVGSHPWWLGLSGPRAVIDTRRGLWCVVGELDLRVQGGADTVAATIARLHRDNATGEAEVVVQAWRRGRFSGADLVAAAEVEAALHALRIPVRLAGPPRTLAEQRDAVAGAALVVAANPRAQAAAFCAGVPVAGWHAAEHPVSRSLGIGAVLTGPAGLSVLRRPDGGTATVATEREDDAAAVLALLSILVTGGRSALEPTPTRRVPPGSAPAPLPTDRSPALPGQQRRTVRPLGVLR